MKKDVLEVLTKLGIQTNANEIMNTSGAGGGAELVPSEVMASEIFESFRTYSSFVSALPGYHGANMDKTQVVDVIGEVGKFNLGSEKTTGAFALAQGTNKLSTGKVTISQKKMEITIDVSDELSVFSKLTAAELEAKLREKIGKAGARTIEDNIINGDIVTAGTGNVNSDDGALASTDNRLMGDGLRKTALAAASSKVDVGALTFDDYISVMNCVGDFAADPADCLWLFNRSTYNKSLGIDQFQDESKNGKQSVIHTGALTNILGSDVFVPRDLLKSEAGGKQSATAANNTLGQFLYFWKPAVQYGFGQELKLKLMDMGKDGYQLQGWFYMGVAIAQKLAGQTDSSVAVGYNVTL